MNPPSGLSGIAATRAIRAMDAADLAAIPIIGVSAHVQEADIRESLAAGMSAVLAKPLSAEALQAALTAHVPQGHALSNLARDLGAARAAALARLYLDGLPGGLADITAAAGAADFAALSRLAHKMKGAAGNFDLALLTDRLARIESLAGLGASADLDACLAGLEAVLEQARQALEAGIDLLDPGVSLAAQ